MTTKEEQIGAGLLAKVGEYLPESGQKLVREALAFAIEAHAGQQRKNGEPVIVHPLHAAETIASLQLGLLSTDRRILITNLITALSPLHMIAAAIRMPNISYGNGSHMAAL